MEQLSQTELRSVLAFVERINAASLRPLGLTHRQAEIAAQVARGKTNPEIAEVLYLSPRTVKRHLEGIYDKLGVRTRTELAALASRAAS